MIAIDTSALVAIALAEPERDAFVRTTREADKVLVSTVSVVEARLVVHARRGQAAVRSGGCAGSDNVHTVNQRRL